MKEGALSGGMVVVGRAVVITSSLWGLLLKLEEPSTTALVVMTTVITTLGPRMMTLKNVMDAIRRKPTKHGDTRQPFVE